MAKINMNIFSTYLKRNVNVDILIPSKNFLDLVEQKFKYEKMEYKMLFLLHGTGDNQSVWVDKTDIETLANEYNVLVVMPSAENTYYTNTTYSVNMKSFIEEELYTFIKNNFPISTKKEDTYILGNSMGGYGSIKIALSNPDKFNNCCSFSGGLDLKRQFEGLISNVIDFKAIFGDLKSIDETEHSIKYLLENVDSEIPNIVLYCGKSDQNLESTKEIIRIMEDMGIKHTFIEDEGEHTWDYWNEHLKIYFRDYIKKEER